MRSEDHENNARQAQAAQQALEEMLRVAMRNGFTGSVGVRIVVKKGGRLGGVRTVCERDVDDGDST